MKGRLHHGTASKIEAHIAKHRKDGGPTKGVDDEEKDLKTKPGDDEDVEREAEEKTAKKGGKIVGKVKGEKHRANGGRAARKSGGSCEDSPFSSARAGTAAKGRKLEKETMD